MIWLPVVLGYLATSCLRWKYKKRITTIQRCFAFLFAGILNIIFSHLFDKTESAGYILLFYVFLFIPLQFVLVVMIDFVLKSITIKQ